MVILVANLQIEAGRFFVVVSLREAEHLRSCMHIRSKSGETLLPNSEAALAIRLLPSGRNLETSVGFVAGRARFQADAAAQLARFLDSDTEYSDRQLGILQRLLGASSPDSISRFFNEVRACRRRPQVPTAETAVGRVLAGPAEGQLGALRKRAVATRMRFELAKKGLRIADGFATMDTDREVGSLCHASIGLEFVVCVRLSLIALTRLQSFLDNMRAFAYIFVAITLVVIIVFFRAHYHLLSCKWVPNGWV